MSRQQNINNALIVKNDEYYTSAEEVEYLISTFPENYFENKIVYSPCDADWSEYVKYFKSHKDELKYKEYIYTSDDMFTHRDIYERVDVVVTNPPFSRSKDFMIFLHELDNVPDYHLICSPVNVSNFLVKFFYNGYVYCYPNFGYRTPSGEIKYINGRSIILTNMKLNNIEYAKKEPTDGIKKEVYLDQLYNGQKVLECKYVRDIPKNYEGYMAVPISVLHDNNKVFDDLFFIDTAKKHKFYKSEDIFPLLNNDFTINDKTLFYRFIVKWKKYVTQEDLDLMKNVNVLKSEPLF